MQIRKQSAADLPYVCSVLQQAFASPAEADLVVQLIVGGFDRLALVAEREGKIVGQILFSEIKIVTNEEPVTALALAPVSVVPEHQRTGIGSSLIREGLELSAKAGHSLVFVLGAPTYYERFGFSRPRAAKFESPYSGDEFMAIDLPGPQDVCGAGRLIYPPPFGALAEPN